MRGKAEANTYHPHYHGITPAYAGKSSCPVTLHRGYRDHPRLCGEKLSFFEAFQCGTGSPPPMRGKVENGAASGAFSRITPAYAGKRA